VEIDIFLAGKATTSDGLFPKSLLPRSLPPATSYGVVNRASFGTGIVSMPLETKVLAISSNCGVPTVAPPPATTMPKLVLNSATTTDAQSVLVDYTVSEANFTQPLKVNVYRSADADPSKVMPTNLVGSATIDPSQLTQGERTATLLSGTSLP